MCVCVCVCVNSITVCQQDHLAETFHRFQSHELFTKEEVYPPVSLFKPPPPPYRRHTHTHTHTHTPPHMYNYIRVTWIALHTLVAHTQMKESPLSLSFSIIKVHCVIISRPLPRRKIIYWNTFARWSANQQKQTTFFPFYFPSLSPSSSVLSPPLNIKMLKRQILRLKGWDVISATSRRRVFVFDPRGQEEGVTAARRVSSRGREDTEPRPHDVIRKNEMLWRYWRISPQRRRILRIKSYFLPSECQPVE